MTRRRVNELAIAIVVSKSGVDKVGTGSGYNGNCNCHPPRKPEGDFNMSNARPSFHACVRPSAMISQKCVDRFASNLVR